MARGIESGPLTLKEIAKKDSSVCLPAIATVRPEDNDTILVDGMEVRDHVEARARKFSMMFCLRIGTLCRPQLFLR